MRSLVLAGVLLAGCAPDAARLDVIYKQPHLEEELGPQVRTGMDLIDDAVRDALVEAGVRIVVQEDPFLIDPPPILAEALRRERSFWVPSFYPPAISRAIAAHAIAPALYDNTRRTAYLTPFRSLTSEIVHEMGHAIHFTVGKEEYERYLPAIVQEFEAYRTPAGSPPDEQRFVRNPNELFAWWYTCRKVAEPECATIPACSSCERMYRDMLLRLEGD